MVYTCGNSRWHICNMVYMWEIDFETDRVDVHRWRRGKLDKQCSDNADLYVVCRMLTENGRVRLERSRECRGILDFKRIGNDTLVIHVISGEVCAASVVVEGHVQNAVFCDWVRSDMAGFRAQLALII